MLRRGLGRLAALLVVLGTVMIGGAGAASAHAVLVATTPAGFQVLDAAPRAVSLRFSEPVDVAQAEVRLVGPGGADVPDLSRPAHPDGRLDTVAVAVPAGLADGTYTVTYRVISADSHPVSGAFAFSVGEVTGGVASGAAPDGASGAVSLLSGVARWLAYAGLAFLIGTAFLVVACWPGGEVTRGVRRLLWTGWSVLLGATLATYLFYGPLADGGSLGDVADPGMLAATAGTRMGVVLGIRVVLLGAVAAGLVWLRRTVPFGGYSVSAHRRRGGVVLGAGAALAVTWGLANHNGAGAQIALALPADVVHLLAMSVWLGGLPALLGVLLRSGDVAGMRIAVPRFSRTALICVAVLVVTGTYQAWRAVGTPAALFGTTYGTLLVVKLGAVVVLVALGALARNWVRRHYGFEIVTVTDKKRARRGPERREVSRFRRLVTCELVIAAVALGATATLVNAEPAAAEQARIQAEAEMPERTGLVNTVVPFRAGGEQGDGLLAVLVTPGAVGRNEVHLAVLDRFRRPKPVAELRAEFRLPSKRIAPIPVELRLIGRDHAIGMNAPITMPGRWELAVTIRTSEIDQTVVRVPVGAR
jgi:copper transport protein